VAFEQRFSAKKVSSHTLMNPCKLVVAHLEVYVSVQALTTHYRSTPPVTTEIVEKSHKPVGTEYNHSTPAVNTEPVYTGETIDECGNSTTECSKPVDTDDRHSSNTFTYSSALYDSLHDPHSYAQVLEVVSNHVAQGAQVVGQCL